MSETATQTAPTGARRRAILAIAISAIALETSLLGIVAPLLPEIEERTGAGDAALGLALAAYALPILVVSLPLGRLADRIGRKPLLLGGLAVTGAGSVLIAFSDTLGALLVGRAVQGLGSTGSWVAALALVSDLAPPGRKGESIGFALAANSFGAIAGPALGGIAGGAIAFEAPFFAVAALALIMLIAGVFVLPGAWQRRPTSELTPGPGMIRTLMRPAVVPAALVAVAGASFFGMVDFAVPLDLDRRLGTSATAIGLLFAGAACVDAFAAPIAGRASDGRGRRPIVVAGALIVGLSGALLVVLPGFAGTAISLGVFGIGISTSFAAAVPWLDESFGDMDRGLAYGGLNLVYATGYTIGPLLSGFLVGAVSADAVYLLIAVIAFGGALALTLGRGAPEPSRPPDPSA